MEDKLALELLFAIVFGAFARINWLNYEKKGRVSDAVWTGIALGWMIDNLLQAAEIIWKVYL